MMELSFDAPLAQIPAEVEACRRTVRRLSFLALGVTLAAVAAVVAVMAATGVSW